MEVDVQSFYHNLMDSYNSSDSDVPLSKQVCFFFCCADFLCLVFCFYFVNYFRQVLKLGVAEEE